MTVDYVSAKRFILGALLLVVLWQLGGSAIGFGMLLKQQHQEQQKIQRIIQQKMDQQAKPPNPMRLPPTHSGTKLTSAALVGHLRHSNASDLAADPKRLL